MDKEAFAQKIAQQEDSGIYSATYDFESSPKEDKETKKFFDDISNNTPHSNMFNDYCEKKYTDKKDLFLFPTHAKNKLKRIPKITTKKPKEKIINLNKYERFWETSTPTGHQITIYSQDNTLLTINCNWPKDYYPRLHKLDKERYGKRSTQRVKKKSKSTRRGKKKR